MVDVVQEWAGKERLFRLNFGTVLDLEEATGSAIGEIFIRVVGGAFRVSDVYHILRLGLIGGGTSIIDAKRLMVSHFDERPYLQNASVAGAILSDLMTGIEESDDDAGDGSALSFGEVSQICRVFNMSPGDLRAMSYSDFVNMVRGYNAASKQQAPHISEEEFIDILNKYEPEAG